MDTQLVGNKIFFKNKKPYSCSVGAHPPVGSALRSNTLRDVGTTEATNGVGQEGGDGVGVEPVHVHTVAGVDLAGAVCGLVVLVGPIDDVTVSGDAHWGAAERLLEARKTVFDDSSGIIIVVDLSGCSVVVSGAVLLADGEQVVVEEPVGVAVGQAVIELSDVEGGGRSAPVGHVGVESVIADATQAESNNCTTQTDTDLGGGGALVLLEGPLTRKSAGHGVTFSAEDVVDVSLVLDVVLLGGQVLVPSDLEVFAEPVLGPPGLLVPAEVGVGVGLNSDINPVGGGVLSAGNAQEALEVAAAGVSEVAIHAIADVLADLLFGLSLFEGSGSDTVVACVVE